LRKGGGDDEDLDEADERKFEELFDDMAQNFDLNK